jgi:hypothetical protein
MRFLATVCVRACVARAGARASVSACVRVRMQKKKKKVQFCGALGPCKLAPFEKLIQLDLAVAILEADTKKEE